MTEFAFFDSKEERWGEKMRAVWGDLSIFPCLDSLELPHHTLGELQSISQLKIWGNTQEPHDDMAYLLVHTEGDSEAKSYGMALVWTNPHQAHVSMMEEALGTLSACISSGPDWPYILAQLYKGLQSHTPTQGQALRHPAPGKGRGEATWADQPTQSPPATICWAMSRLSSRLKWVQPVSYHQLTRTTAQWL